MLWKNLFKKRSRAISGGMGAIMAIALPFTAHHEGLRLKAYLDPVGIPTICFGETEGVEIGQVKSREECDKMLAVRLAYFAHTVKQQIHVPIGDEMHASLASFTYNVGVSAFKGSTLLRKLNMGDYEGACNELDRWVYAQGKVLNGLVKRRHEEKRLCLSGIPKDIDV